MSTPSFLPPYGGSPGPQPTHPLPTQPLPTQPLPTYPPPYPAVYPMPHPHPGYAPPSAVSTGRPTTAEPPQRPALVGMSTMLTVTASMLFMSALGLLWMLAWAGNESLDYNAEGGLYYIMERFHLRLAQGLWVPLFGLPTASIVLAFCLLARRPWARIAYTALGVFTVGWLVVRWHDQPGYLIAPIAYIAFCAGILWISSVSRWLSWSAMPRDRVTT